MSIMPYESWSPLRSLDESVNRLFGRTNRFLLDEARPDSLAGHWIPAVDIQEQPERFILHADLPGVSPEDIDITMENGVLTLRGERKLESHTQREGFRRAERLQGTFYRRFSLPSGADQEHISANYRNGVLEVVIPKAEEVRPRRITVEG